MLREVSSILHTTDKSVLSMCCKIAGLKKASVQVQSCESVSLSGRNWSGGHRNVYFLVDLASGTAIRDDSADVSIVNAAQVSLRPGLAILKHAYAGTRQYLVLFVHPENLQKFIEKQAELSDDEARVLWFTRSLKSSYAGIKNYRFSECSRRFPEMTLERWETAKTSLIAKKLLNRAGAITVNGRNACPERI